MAASLVGVAFMSCSSQDDVLTPAGQTYTMSVTAQKGGDETRALNLDGTTLNATWTEGDVVKVYNSASTELGELTAQTAGKSTTLSGTLDELPSNDETLTLKYLSPSYSQQDGTLTGADNSIDKVCDYATATVTATVSGTNVTTGAAAFQNQQTVVKFTLKDKDGNALPSNPTAFTINDGTDDIVKLTDIPAESYSANGEGVLYVAIPGFTGKTITLTATVGSDTYTCTTSEAKTLENGKYYGVTAQMTKQAAAPEGALNGEFSVSATKKVKFSKGNLRYASGTWSFFDNQYDYYTSYSADAWDKFGWSTSATTYGMNTSEDSGDYSGDFVDWGSNSDLQTALGTGWFTLSSAEWTYLFKTRTNAASKYGYATVAGKAGIIIVPDDFTDPMKNNGSGAFVGSTTTGWTANVYSAENWSAMETAGCVFLPAAGRRNGSSVSNSGTVGGYWSATPAGYFAYRVDFASFILNPETSSLDRTNGFSVRLVKDVAAPAPAVPAGALNGEFSVSATKTVKFSQGNLQATYNGSTWTWSFAANQWDYIGDAAKTSTGNGNTSISGNGTLSANGTVDLFGWSTSTTYFGINNSTNNNTYSGDFVDWGSNSDLQTTLGTGWFTLSKDEWQYLFITRTVNGGTSFGKSWTLGQVNNVSGVVLYPDDYTGELYTTAQSGNWSAFESAGCVFLPAALLRNGTSVLGTVGYYWSSTANGTGKAYDVLFMDDVSPTYTDDRKWGFSVRLVREVE